MKTRKLRNVQITCEPPTHIYRWNLSLERQADVMEAWVEEFHDFMREHRPQDPVNLSVERLYRDECSFCGSEWEAWWDIEGPCCCNKAIEEYVAQKEKVQP